VQFLVKEGDFVMKQQICAGTYPIIWDDARRCIEVNGYALRLSPTQYRIFRAFAEVVPSTIPVSDEIAILAYRSYRKLEAETELSHGLLVRHISNLNARTMSLELQLCSFQAGYLLIFPASSAQTYGSGGKEGS
jgi:hypothetical protein